MPRRSFFYQIVPIMQGIFFVFKIIECVLRLFGIKVKKVLGIIGAICPNGGGGPNGGPNSMCFSECAHNTEHFFDFNARYSSGCLHPQCSKRQSVPQITPIIQDTLLTFLPDNQKTPS